MDNQLFLVHIDQIGQEVRDIRDSLRLTQEQLAQAVGYQAGGNIAISRFEKGKSLPPASRLAAIATELNISVDQLFLRARLHETSCQLPDSQCADPSYQMRAAKAQATPLRAESMSVSDLRADIELRLQALAPRLDEAVTRLLAKFTSAHSAVTEPSMRILSKLPEDDPLREFLSASTDLPSLDTDVTSSAAADLAERRKLASKGMTSLLADVAANTAGAGVLGGAFAAGLYASVATFGTAGTGALISGLSGAAASSATLAWLGSGTLASGGLGVAGGTALLTGVVAVPIVLALGATIWMKQRERDERKREEREQLKIVSAKVDELEVLVSRTIGWVDLCESSLEKAESVGKGLVIACSARISQGSSDADFRVLVEMLKRVCVEVAVLQGLEIWFRVKDLEPASIRQQEEYREFEINLDEQLRQVQATLGEIEEAFGEWTSQQFN